MPPHIRTGQAPSPLDREAFGVRFRASFADPAFTPEANAIARLEEIAWQAYSEGRKSPLTQPAGPDFADPAFELSVEWLNTRQRILDAQQRWADPHSPTRILLICGAARNDGTCPGEMSKSFRLLETIKSSLKNDALEIDTLDLSLLSSEYGKHIYPCKGCVSTAMPLCHWPCSCYPNHALNQINDWMAEIYERWVAAHAIIIVTPVYWYQSPSPLKLMIDRLVCADGGNPDPTVTQGKNAAKAKTIELAGWQYPKHLDKRVYGLIVHGDVAGVETTRQDLSNWLDWMGLIEAGPQSRLDRYIGYYEPYASSHEALDRDAAIEQEARNVAEAVMQTILSLRNGQLTLPVRLPAPRPK